MTLRQLTFDLGRPAALARAAFVPGAANAVALAAIDGWAAWPQGRMALAGPAGAGKTHLAHIWAAQAGARVAGPADLTEAAVPALAGAPCALDAAEAVAGDAAQERALFHLLNLSRETGQPLLLTGRAAPARWPVALPDLKSRLAALPLTEIGAPDDALLTAVYEKLFADRQVSVAKADIAYLVTRAPRGFAAAAALVDRLDRQALADKSNIRGPLIRRVLEDGSEFGHI